MQIAVRAFHEAAVLRHDGHGRIDGAKRCPHDAHPAGGYAGLHQARPRAGKIMPWRLAVVRPDVARGDYDEIKKPGLFQAVGP